MFSALTDELLQFLLTASWNAKPQGRKSDEEREAFELAREECVVELMSERRRRKI